MSTEISAVEAEWQHIVGLLAQGLDDEARLALQLHAQRRDLRAVQELAELECRASRYLVALEWYDVLVTEQVPGAALGRAICNYQAGNFALSLPVLRVHAEEGEIRAIRYLLGILQSTGDIKECHRLLSTHATRISQELSFLDVLETLFEDRSDEVSRRLLQDLSQQGVAIASLTRLALGEVAAEDFEALVANARLVHDGVELVCWYGGFCAIDLGDLTTATALFTQLWELGDSDGLVGLATVAKEAEDWNEAAERLQEAIDNGADYQDLRLDKVKMLSASGRNLEYRVELDALVAEEYLPAMELSAEELFSAGSKAASFHLFERAAALGSETAILELAKIECEEQQNHELVVKLLANAELMQDSEALLYRGYAELRLNHFDQARKDLKAALARGEAFALAYLGNLEQQMGDHTAAIDYFLSFLAAVDSPPSWVLSNFGNSLEKLGRLQEAITQYTMAAEQEHVPSMFQLGVLTDLLGETATAETWLLRAAESGSADAMNNLGVLADDHEESIRWFRKAALQGDEVAMHNLGCAAYENDEYSAAMSWWTRSADLGYPNAMGALASLADERGDKATADSWRKRAADAREEY